MVCDLLRGPVDVAVEDPTGSLASHIAPEEDITSVSQWLAFATSQQVAHRLVRVAYSWQWSRPSGTIGRVGVVNSRLLWIGLLGPVGIGVASLSLINRDVVEDHSSLVTNSDDGAWTVAAEELPADGDVADFTHGILTVENSTDVEVRLQQVELMDVVGSVTLVAAYVAPPGRETLYVSSDSQFPPRDVELTLEPLSNYTITPNPQGQGAERSEEVVLHLRVPTDQEVAGYSGYCLDFVLEGTRGLRRTCNEHAFFACRDVDAPECGPERP